MMDDNRFDDVLQDLPRSFNTPPEPPLDEMWTVIEDAHFNAPIPIPATRGITPRTPWLAAAAALLIGIGVGRFLPRGGNSPGNAASPRAIAANVSSAPSDTSAVANAYRDQTTRYLGQAAALLV